MSARDLFAGELFGSHVSRRTVADLGAFELVNQAGDAEIAEQHLAASVEHGVGRLEVAMQDPFFMCRSEPGTETSRKFRTLCRREGGQCGDSAGRRRGKARRSTFRWMKRLLWRIKMRTAELFHEDRSATYPRRERRQFVHRPLPLAETGRLCGDLRNRG